ncbi:MAG: SMC-Scp complex subunit ScpB [Planctomycetota bacterium]
MAPSPETGPEPLNLGALEAVLLAMDRPMPPSRLAAVLGLDEAGADGAIEAGTTSLNEIYAETGRAFRIERVAGGYRVMTLPEHAAAVAAARGMRSERSLSRASLETLAIVAYRQPITRARVEAIRGAACGEVLRGLLEKRLVKIAGRAEELGRPMLYATTERFLEVFGLASLKDLPTVGDLTPMGTTEIKPGASPEVDASEASSPSDDVLSSEAATQEAPT